MAFGEIVLQSQLLFLIFVRVFAMLQASPMLGSDAVATFVRLGLAMATAVVVLPLVAEAGYPVPDTGLAYAGLMVGEALVGVIIGLYLNVIFAALQTAGQFFSFQMGFGASQVLDPLAQVQLPLMGQLFNIVAMLVFVTTAGFQRLFFFGVYRSFQALSVPNFALVGEDVARMFMRGLSGLFQQALIIALPIVGTLLIVNLTLGLMSKAAPQMNLLMLGFPMAITVAFLMLIIVIPTIMPVFAALVESAFDTLMALFYEIGARGT